MFYKFPDITIEQKTDWIQIKKNNLDGSIIFINTQGQASETDFDFVINDTYPVIGFPDDGIKGLSFYKKELLEEYDGERDREEYDYD